MFKATRKKNRNIFLALGNSTSQSAKTTGTFMNRRNKRLKLKRLSFTRRTKRLKRVTIDIALIYLEKEIQWTKYVKPICVSADNDVSFSGVIATATGWGTTHQNGEG